MAKLWLVTILMMLVGGVLVLGSVFANLGPVAMICGVLLVWSAIVKLVVLRVWRATLPVAPVDDSLRATSPSANVRSELA